MRRALETYEGGKYPQTFVQQTTVYTIAKSEHTDDQYGSQLDLGTSPFVVGDTQVDLIVLRLPCSPLS